MQGRCKYHSPIFERQVQASEIFLACQATINNTKKKKGVVLFLGVFEHANGSYIENVRNTHKEANHKGPEQQIMLDCGSKTCCEIVFCWRPLTGP